MEDGAPGPSPRRSATVLVVLVLTGALMALGFTALGLWQVQRLSWKTDLIARIDRQLRADPSPLPAPAEWPAITRERDEYRRLRIEGRYDYTHETLVRGASELGTGYWVLTPLRTDGGAWVLVNRGFVPQEMRQQVPRAQGAGPAASPGPDAGAGPVSVVGLLRLSEPGGGLLQPNEPAAGRWYSRDVAAIAAARALQGPVAPFFLDAQATPGAGGTAAQAWPRAGLTVIRFSNNHSAYALTWFALAAIMLGAVGYLLVDERRQRRAGATLGDDPPTSTT